MEVAFYVHNILKGLLQLHKVKESFYPPDDIKTCFDSTASQVSQTIAATCIYCNFISSAQNKTKLAFKKF